MLLRKSQEKKLLTKINKKDPYIRHFLFMSFRNRKKNPLHNVLSAEQDKRLLPCIA